MSLTVRKVNVQNLTNKKYISARKTRNFALLPAALNLGFAMSEASAHNLPTMTFLAIQGFVFLKVAEKAINTMLEHRTDYYKIVNRSIGLKIAKYKNLASKVAEDSDKLTK